MSIGNLKTYGNKGNNFPFQLAVLKGLDLSKGAHLNERVVTAASVVDLETAINAQFATDSDKYLISKSIVYDPVGLEFTAFITFATI